MIAALRVATLADALSGAFDAARGEARTALAADAELARRCLAGDEAAQRELAERASRLVFALCRRRGLAPDAAEDVTQDVLADAVRGLPRYRAESRLSSWLFAIACRRLADHYRSPASRTVAAGRPGDEGFPGGEPADERWEERFAERDRARAVRAAVEALAEPARTVLLAFYLAELSVGEIADRLSLPPGTVKSHLHRGRAAVRGKLVIP